MPEAIATARPGPFARAFAALRLPMGDPFAVAGLAIYAVFILTAILAPQIATHDPTEILYTADYDLAAGPAAGGAGLRPGHHQPRARHLQPDRLRLALRPAGRVHRGDHGRR